MSKKKTSSHPAPQSHARPAAKSNSSKLTPAQRARDARDARKFFIVLGVGVVLLVLFLYFIFVGRG
jgi:uncharacterized integral membrane protein